MIYRAWSMSTAPVVIMGGAVASLFAFKYIYVKLDPSFNGQKKQGVPPLSK